MPRESAALISTDREVVGAPLPAKGKRAEYRVKGSPNLVLRVTAAGTRTWMLWLRRPKTAGWQKLTLGTYPAITLARARRAAMEHAVSIADGVDPFDERERASNALTIRALGEVYIARHAKPKKRSWADDERHLAKNVYPVLGKMLAEQVRKPDVIRMLDGIHDRGAPVLANRVLALVRKLFNFAVAEGYVEASPARDIPSRAKEEPRTRTLADVELRGLWNALDGAGFDPVTADALRLQLLLGARVREITGMHRTELSLSAEPPIWTLPKVRAKGNREVPRPLPPLALSIVVRRLAAAGDSGFVFASPQEPTQPLTPRAPARAVQRAGEKGIVPAGFTPHDLRRTCRTRLAKLGISETVAKKILGHAPPRSDVTASVYDQHTYIPEMVAALFAWERHLSAIVAGEDQPSNVIVMRAVDLA